MRHIGLVILALCLACASDSGASAGGDDREGLLISGTTRPKAEPVTQRGAHAGPRHPLDPVEAIRAHPNYVEQRVRGVGLGTWGGPLRLDLELDEKGLPQRSFYVARDSFFVDTDPFVGRIEIALTGQVYASEQEARYAVASSPLHSTGHMLYAHFLGEEGIIFPTLISETTAPRLARAVRQVLSNEKDNARAASNLLLQSVLLAAGLRAPMPAAAGATRAGRLLIDSSRQLSREELEMARLLVSEGRTVRALSESTARTADFLVDGVATELKTLSNLTSRDLSGAMARRILEGAGQGAHIIVDVRRQSGMTLELARRAVSRAYGADTARRILLVRVIGDGFDFLVERT